MRIRHVGATGLKVSELGLGTLTWGRDTDAPEAQEMLDTFVNAGGTLLEVGPTHGDGLAMDVVGSLLPLVGRHRIILALRGAAHLGADGRWVTSASRGDMLASLDDALARLGTDHVDVWLAGPEPVAPLDESLAALEVAWRSGRARYVGLSHRGTWDTAMAVAWGSGGARTGVGVPITLVEEEYSLLSRLDEADLLPGALRHGVGVFAHSPLAGGVLTGKYRHSTPPDSRAASPHLRHLVAPHLTHRGASIVEAVARAAQGLDRTPMDVALTWVKDAPGVSSAVVGPRTARQLDQLLGGGAPLPAQIRQVLDEVSTPGGPSAL